MQNDLFYTQEALSDAEFSSVLREASQYQRGIRDCVDDIRAASAYPVAEGVTFSGLCDKHQMPRDTMLDLFRVVNQSAGATVLVFALELTLFAGAVLLALTSCTPLY
jgi:hypothetical protein